MFSVYILHSPLLDKYYIGHTGEDLDVRLRKHLSNHRGFTARIKDWRVVYHEEYPDKPSAYSRELELKSWKSKIRLKDLIGSARRLPLHPGECFLKKSFKS